MLRGHVGLFASNLTIPILDDSRKTDKGRLAIKVTFHSLGYIEGNNLVQEFWTLSRSGLSIQGNCVFDRILGDGG